MKAIIELGKRGSIFSEVRTQLEGTSPADYHLSFESARKLFSELTPARFDLLQTLRNTGSCSVYALAKMAERNYSNVHGDIARLIDLGLVERAEDDTVCVPFDDVEVHFHLAKAA
jgi:predicted transcriptional regulator